MDSHRLSRIVDAWAMLVDEAHLDLEAARTESDRMAAEDMLLVWRTAHSFLRDARDEEGVRATIQGVGALANRQLDAAAFIKVQELIEVLRELLGDVHLDLGEVPRSAAEAIAFLPRQLSAETKQALTQDLSQDEARVRLDFRLGMAVRNSLRSAGFTETALGVRDPDDVWFGFVKAALRGPLE